MRDRMKVHFCGPTGANAVDAAIKLCKTATGRGDVVSFQGGFHGSSHAAMALTGLVAQKAPIANGVPGRALLPVLVLRRCPLGLRRDSCETNCVALLERALRDPNGGIARPAAVILELVQGEGGVIPADRDFVRRVRALTRELDIPLVVDEVQTGCGRTGTWFAFEQYDIEPDVIVASKALSGIGQPVALIMYDERLDVWAARRAHRHLPRQPARLRRRGAGGADHAPRRRAGQRAGARRRRSPSGSAAARPPGGARGARPGPDVGRRAGRPGDGRLGRGAGRPGAGPGAAAAG